MFKCKDVTIAKMMQMQAELDPNYTQNYYVLCSTFGACHSQG